MRLSLVICTYNRAEVLAHALESIAAQEADPSCFEIIVVDNNSTDQTRELVDQHAARQSNVRYVHESRPGLRFARDAGYHAAQTDWVMYLDDDIKAPPNLVDRAIHVIDTCSFDCFGGLCVPWYEHGQPRWLHDRYVINEVDPSVTTGVLENGFAKGALIVFRKSVLEELGGFTDPKGRPLGMTKKKIAYGEETRLQVEMRKRGYTIGFDRELKVDHLVHRDRLQARFYLQMRFAKGRDHWATFGDRPTWPRLLACLVLAVVTPLWRVPLCLVRLITRRGYYPTNVLLDALYPSATRLGQAYGAMQLLLGRRG